MSSSKGLQPVARYAASREREAARALGESQQRVREQEIRLQELIEYQAEYRRQLTQSGQSGLDAAQLQEFRAFLLQLGEAITQQEQVIAQCRSQSEQERQHWIERHHRSEVLDRLIDRRKANELQVAEQREQKIADERVGHTHARNSNRHR